MTYAEIETLIREGLAACHTPLEHQIFKIVAKKDVLELLNGRKPTHYLENTLGL